MMINDIFFKKFYDLKKPEKLDIYNIINIPASKHKLGKKKNGAPVVLIPILKTEKKTVADIKLRNLSVFFNVLCKLSYKQRIIKGKYTIIEFTGSNSELYDPFLRIALLIMSSLSKEPNIKEISQTVEKFINLFESILAPPRKTVQGLWSELFIIYQSKNPKILVEAWHSIPEEKYDFSYKNSRLEVKSSSKRERIHYFSFEQLDPPREVNLAIASVFVERNSSGKNVVEITNEISKKIIKDKKLNEKLFTITISTLGNSFEESKNIKFDPKLAAETIKYYDYKKIPNICKKHKPHELRDIKFKSDISAIKDISKKDLMKKGQLFRYL